MIVKRNIAICIVLSIVTCGIYGIYWMICLANDANTVSGEPNGTSGGMVFLFTLITCGIYHFYFMYKQGEKIDRARQNRNMPGSNGGVLYLVLSIFGLTIVSYALIQDELNKLA